MSCMSPETKHFLFKFLSLIAIAPFFGYGSLLVIENITNAWKTKSKVKKWWALTITVICLGIALEWLI